MTPQQFETILDVVCTQLTAEARSSCFKTSKEFEDRVREVVQGSAGIPVDYNPHPQAFPDIAIGKFGIEVKFTLNDTWRSVANSVLETNRIEEVEKVYLVFGKMGGAPEVKWGEYEKCVMHVRTSHVPRFEVAIAAERSLFDLMEIPYDTFRSLPMEEKMRHVRKYARNRLKPGERLWWLDDSPEPEHSLPMQARLYTTLSAEEKTKLRAEAVLLCPQIVKHGRGHGNKDKYNDFVLYLLTYHGVLCHQARDLVSAGSVANPKNDNAGGNYIERALKLLQDDMLSAASYLDDALFVEYWGESVQPEDRIQQWLEKADKMARGWLPSRSLFREYQKERLTARE